ncbi:MAG TPA: phage major capsid protein [Alphaproteobacteria bacterium]|nr:phage major capsid protein [Alphaproteobacteria bacterium]
MIEMNEVRAATETLARAFEDYKDVNDRRLTDIERKGGADVLLDEKLGRMDTVINRLQDDVTSVKTAMRRPGKGASAALPENSEYKQAFLRYLTKGSEQDLFGLQGKAMEVIDAAEGGFMIPPELSNRIVTRQYDTTPMRQVATVMTISTEAIEMLRDTNEPEAQWISETAAPSDTLSNLLRGRRATESAVASHVVGENFVLLVPGAVDFLPALLTDRGREYEFRALSNGQALGDAQDVDFTYGLKTIAPFSPVHVSGNYSSGDLTIGWVRRARLNADWVDYIDVPLDEPSELYDVDVMDGTSAVRTFSSLTSPSAVYTAAEQATDWGTSIPSSFSLNIYQISSRYGRGQAVGATI